MGQKRLQKCGHYVLSERSRAGGSKKAKELRSSLKYPPKKACFTPFSVRVDKPVENRRSVAIPPFRALPAALGEAEGGLGFGVGGGSLQPFEGGEVVMSRSLLEVDWLGKTIEVG